MFLENNYILSNELVQKMNIHIANISMLKQDLENNGNVEDIIKMNNCTFINKNSRYLPKNIRIGILQNDFTDISDKLPCTYALEIFECNNKEITTSGIVKEKISIAGKNFYVFTQKFIDTIQGKVVNVLDYDDTMDCYRDKQIDEYIRLSKNKFITWY